MRKTRGRVMSRPNLPEPKSSADKLAARGAELLDKDQFDRLDTHRISVGGVTYWIANDDYGIRIETGYGGPSRVTDAIPSTPYRSLFWESYERFCDRMVERRADAVLAEVTRKSESKEPWWRFWR